MGFDAWGNAPDLNVYLFLRAPRGGPIRPGIYFITWKKLLRIIPEGTLPATGYHFYKRDNVEHAVPKWEEKYGVGAAVKWYLVQ